MVGQVRKYSFHPWQLEQAVNLIRGKLDRVSVERFGVLSLKCQTAERLGSRLKGRMFNTNFAGMIYKTCTSRLLLEHFNRIVLQLDNHGSQITAVALRNEVLRCAGCGR
ncbi:hypothetical protein D3C81_904080 [compost metagenome]